MTEDGYILIGKIVGVHGIRGLLKLLSYAESVSVFESDAFILFRDSGGRERQYTVEWVRPHKRILLLSLEGVHDRDEAESLVGSELFVRRSALPEADEGSYYWSDLMGLSVFTTEGSYLGRLMSVIPTGSNDVYVVRDGKKETLVPALASVVTKIDLEKKTMQVNLPEGLL